ncbi:hypothetical protein DL769_010356 [Monosporascus sp. CRB-8-3]|nr:hypothetical protein DL769_010356 [Monosporascus sp. CRB-8-3]
MTTTDSNGDTITTTVTEETVITPGPGPGTSDPTNTSPWLLQSTVSKLPAIQTAGPEGSGGLTKPQLGGIIAGVVIVLVVVVVAAFLIIRKLKQTEKAVAMAGSSKRDDSSGNQRSHKQSFGQPTISEVDGFDADLLMQSPSIRPSHIRSGSDDSFAERSPSRTPKVPSTSTTPPAWPGPYNPATISEAPSECRTHSMDSTRAAHDASRYSQQTQRVSYDSQGSHSRHWSNASELSGSAVDGPAKAELESEAVEQANRRRSSTSAARTPITHARKSSGGAARGRSESAAATVALGTVNEFGELHGYYGPPDQAVGQTAERLDRESSTASSMASRQLKEAAARLKRGDSSVSSTPTEAYRKNKE